MARRIIEKSGTSGLSFRAVAKDRKLEVSPSTLLHHFGTLAGLLGAVAAEGFGRLAEELERERTRLPLSRGTLERLTAKHVAFALENQRLYQAMHSPDLWTNTRKPARTPTLRENPPKEKAFERALPRIELAVGARNATFEQYEAVVAGLIGTGTVRSELEATDVARMVTTIIDGWLFQRFNEQVGADEPIEDQISYVVRLVRAALEGVVVAAR